MAKLWAAYSSVSAKYCPCNRQHERCPGAIGPKKSALPIGEECERLEIRQPKKNYFLGWKYNLLKNILGFLYLCEHSNHNRMVWSTHQGPTIVHPAWRAVCLPRRFGYSGVVLPAMDFCLCHLVSTEQQNP